MSNVAQNQPLPQSVVDRLLAFADTAISLGELDHAARALKCVSWNVRTITSEQRRTLANVMREFRNKSQIIGASEIEIRGILQLGGFGDAETYKWGLLEEIADARDRDLPVIVFQQSDISVAGGTTQLMSGWHLNDLISVSRIAMGLPKQTTRYRNVRMLHFLEKAGRDAIRAGVPTQRLGPVFQAIADLRRQFVPNDFRAMGIRRILREAQDDYSQRQVRVQTVIAVLGGMEYQEKVAIVNDLRREWTQEREPETKYALATIIIESSQRGRLNDADLRLKFPLSR